MGHGGKSALLTRRGKFKKCDNTIAQLIRPGIAGGISARLSSTTWAQSGWVRDLHVLPVDSSHLDSVVNRTVKKKKKKKKTSFKSHVSRSWISFEEQLTAVENLIRRCHNVGNLSDRSQDVHINTQMLNGWRMSEWKVAAAAAKIHSSRKPTQVHTPGTATGSWHALTCTWHSSLQADVNPGHRWLHQSEQTFFHLISVFWKCRGPLPQRFSAGPGTRQEARSTSQRVLSLATLSALPHTITKLLTISSV